MPTAQELEHYNKQFSFGGAATGAAAGGATGGIPGAILGGLTGGLSGGQPVQKPFDIKVQKPSPGTQSAYMTGMFGTQGNYNPDACYQLVKKQMALIFKILLVDKTSNNLQVVVNSNLSSNKDHNPT